MVFGIVCGINESLWDECVEVVCVWFVCSLVFVVSDCCDHGGDETDGVTDGPVGQNDGGRPV